jgi:hypothetical protein
VVEARKNAREFHIKPLVVRQRLRREIRPPSSSLRVFALVLGLLPRRLFVPREYELEGGETWIAEGTATVTWE